MNRKEIIRDSIEKGLVNHIPESMTDDEYKDMVDDLEFEVTKIYHDGMLDGMDRAVEILKK